MKEGFVYGGVLCLSTLQKLCKKLGLRVQLSWSLTLLDFFEEFRDAGTAFDVTCELRWHRLDEERFEVLVLSDQPIEDLPLQILPGQWQIEEYMTQLIDLTSPQFSAQFETYPEVSTSNARLRCRAFYRDGVVIFVSPREILPYETAESEC